MNHRESWRNYKMNGKRVEAKEKKKYQTSVGAALLKVKAGGT
jgi:hypothetical protein